MLESTHDGQIAFVSGRTGEPQIYIMDQDGANVQRMTDSGYAISPSWSPNGGLLTFSWNRKYGPGDPGSYDIYVMDIASKNWLQATHEAGINDFPSWSPDRRHIVFQRQIGHRTQIWTMLADGTEQHQLTFSGDNTSPTGVGSEHRCGGTAEVARSRIVTGISIVIDYHFNGAENWKPARGPSKNPRTRSTHLIF